MLPAKFEMQPGLVCSLGWYAAWAGMQPGLVCSLGWVKLIYLIATALCPAQACSEPSTHVQDVARTVLFPLEDWLHGWPRLRLRELHTVGLRPVLHVAEPA
jgi:hypothetical protein